MTVELRKGVWCKGVENTCVTLTQSEGIEDIQKNKNIYQKSYMEKVGKYGKKNW